MNNYSSSYYAQGMSYEMLIRKVLKRGGQRLTSNETAGSFESLLTAYAGGYKPQGISKEKMLEQHKGKLRKVMEKMLLNPKLQAMDRHTIEREYRTITYYTAHNLSSLVETLSHLASR